MQCNTMRYMRWNELPLRMTWREDEEEETEGVQGKGAKKEGILCGRQRTHIVSLIFPRLWQDMASPVQSLMLNLRIQTKNSKERIQI